MCLLLPQIQGLAQLCFPFEAQNINHLEVLHVAILFKFFSDFVAENGWREVQQVQFDDAGCLDEEKRWMVNGMMCGEGKIIMFGPL
jgi:hypothetical protein